jgi:hypothetical protein
MRLAVFASSALALAALSGCSSRPAAPEGAWAVTLDKGSSTTCSFSADVQAMLGEVTAGSVITKVFDGQPDPNDVGSAAVSCVVSVTGTGTFSVDGTATTGNGDKVLHVSIPSITPSATQTSPAIGSVNFTSPQIAVAYTAQSTCSFYFRSGEGIAAGSIFGAFTCDPIGDDSSSCAMSESYFTFDNCESM